MQQIAITTLAGFDAARDRWDDLFEADPHGQIFLSFAWLRSYLPDVADPWRLVVLEEAGAFVAALPLVTRPTPHRLLPIASELSFAGSPLADYQGMLCRPGCENDVAAALASAIRSLKWDRAVFADVQDPRFSAVLAQLGTGIRVHENPATPCYAFELPADFTTLLAGWSKKTRFNTQRPLRVLAARLPALRVTCAGADDQEAHVDAVVRLNIGRWGGNAVRALRLTALLRNSCANGCVRLHVIWDGTRPVAGSASFTDPVHGAYGLYLLGRDVDYEQFSAGTAVLALAVQDAIEHGYRTFDFMRGGEEYKRKYSTREQFNQHFMLARPGLRALLLRALQPAYNAAKAAAVRLLYRPRNA